MAVSSQWISQRARWRVSALSSLAWGFRGNSTVILGLLTLSLASGFAIIFRRYFPATGFGLRRYEYWIMGLVTALAFLGCIRLHELGHSFVARARGTALGLIGMPAGLPTALTEFFMAVAGLAVSLGLAVAFLTLAGMGYNREWWLPLEMVLGYLAAINGLILAFHIVPAYPLDGGRVFRSILWGLTGNLPRATYWASLSGQTFAWLLAIAGTVLIFRWNWFGGVSCILVGLCLNGAARSAYKQMVARQISAGEPTCHESNSVVATCRWKRAVEVGGVFLGLILLNLLTT